LSKDDYNFDCVKCFEIKLNVRFLTFIKWTARNCRAKLSERRRRRRRQWVLLLKYVCVTNRYADKTWQLLSPSSIYNIISLLYLKRLCKYSKNILRILLQCQKVYDVMEYKIIYAVCLFFISWCWKCGALKSS